MKIINNNNISLIAKYVCSFAEGVLKYPFYTRSMQKEYNPTPNHKIRRVNVASVSTSDLRTCPSPVHKTLIYYKEIG
jgi:hypothetical protein